MRNILFVAVSCMILVLCSCLPIDKQKDLVILAKYHQQEQTAHLTKNVALFVEIMSDTVTHVQKGAVKKLTKQQMQERFSQYFSMVEFIKWEDTAPPVYYIADDGSMASVLVQKRVELKVKSDSTGAIEKTDFAWTELWRKERGQWRMHTNISTEKTIP